MVGSFSRVFDGRAIPGVSLEPAARRLPPAACNRKDRLASLAGARIDNHEDTMIGNERNWRGSTSGVALAAWFVVAAGSASGAVLVDYNLTNIVTSSASPAASAPATTVATGITASDVTRGPGLTAISLARGFSSQGWNSASGTTTTRAEAISGNKFYGFDLTIAPGATASFSDITVGLYKSAITSPANFEWQYSLDAFATPGTTLVTFNHFGRNSGTAPGSLTPFQWMTTDTPGQTNGNPTPPLDISTVAALQNLAGPATVGFRLYGWGSINGNPTTSTNTLAFGRDAGPLINGTVAVPEPNTVVLAATGSLAVLAMLRGRRRR